LRKISTKEKENNWKKEEEKKRKQLKRTNLGLQQKNIGDIYKTTTTCKILEMELERAVENLVALYNNNGIDMEVKN